MKQVKRCIWAVASVLPLALGQTAVTNNLGISEFRVSETTTELHIGGLDLAGVEVAKLTLTAGATGRSLSVDVRGQKAFHESRGFAPLRLPPLSRKDRSDLNAFLLDSHVSSALEKWGIAVGQRPKLQAADDQSHKCTFAENVTAMGTSCCEMPIAGGVEELVCIGDRENYGFVDRICTKPNDPNNPCGATGPNGCAVCWMASRSNHCFTAVDSNDSGRCAYEFR